ncbi:cobalamin B12-binding domain-containing protein [Sunxiuqinia indica]|uniref:cobalamin B12-binding domain-containing protein n=1 Tax=Sunxiuqinia indica TaxID=2692584 RepID=UPI0013571BEF|nr:cobalamin-dependent protein [Sunxiuqinia indica]
MSEILEKLFEAVEFGKADKASPFPPQLKGQDGANELTKNALDADVDPKDILEQALIPAMERVGKKFSEQKIFVPQMLMSAKAMGASMVQLKPFFASGKIKEKGTFIIGTVKGDLHDIGKNLVSMIVEGGGWKIVDLGVDVSEDKFLEKIDEYPNAVIGLSALLTTTMVNMEDIVKAIRTKKPDARVLIGGAPINDDFCQKIGADYYAADPQKAVEYLNKIAS